MEGRGRNCRECLGRSIICIITEALVQVVTLVQDCAWLLAKPGQFLECFYYLRTLANRLRQEVTDDSRDLSVAKLMEATSFRQKWRLVPPNYKTPPGSPQRSPRQRRGVPGSDHPNDNIDPTCDSGDDDSYGNELSYDEDSYSAFLSDVLVHTIAIAQPE